MSFPINLGIFRKLKLMSTTTRVYDNFAEAQKVVNKLESAGVPAGDISMVANQQVSAEHDDVGNASEAGTGAEIGAVVGGGAGLLAGLGLMAIPGIGPVVAAGWLASTALGAFAGAATGGLIGAMVDSGVPEADAHVYSEAVRRGGTLVTVRTTVIPDQTVVGMMDAHQPIEPLARGEEYRSEGWTKYDPKAPAYKPNETDLERMRRSQVL
jgi:hypothetical protein